MEQAQKQKQQADTISDAIWKKIRKGVAPTFNLPLGDLTNDGSEKIMFEFIKNTVGRNIGDGKTVKEIIQNPNFSSVELGRNAVLKALGNIVTGGVLEMIMYKADIQMQLGVDGYGPTAEYHKTANKLAATIVIAKNSFKNLPGSVEAIESALNRMATNPEYASIIPEVKDMVKKPDEGVVAEIMKSDRQLALNEYGSLAKKVESQNSALENILKEKRPALKS